MYDLLVKSIQNKQQCYREVVMRYVSLWPDYKSRGLHAAWQQSVFFTNVGLVLDCILLLPGTPVMTDHFRAFYLTGT